MTAQVAAPQQLGERELSHLVRLAYRSFTRELAEPLAAHGITVAEWAVMRVLWHDDGLSPADLARRMRVRKASLTSVLDALERAGRLVRTRDPHDRRKLRLELTPQGRALEHEVLHYGVANNERALHGVDAGDAETARRVLEQVIANLDPARN